MFFDSVFPELDGDWQRYLGEELDRPYMSELRSFLVAQQTQRKVVLPPFDSIFNAFNAAPLDNVKVVILGQDPYHGLGQAHGLSFSVPKGVAVPPSLRNIFKEVSQDLGLPTPSHGCLQSWAQQGVLLLNSVLTVESGVAGAHRKQGWEVFTDRAIEILSRESEGVVFMLWGSYAHQKERLIDTSKHLVLKTVHPSPLSAYRGFLGCGHFSQANQYLISHGRGSIDWSVGA